MYLPVHYMSVHVMFRASLVAVAVSVKENFKKNYQKFRRIKNRPKSHFQFIFGDSIGWAWILTKTDNLKSLKRATIRSTRNETEVKELFVYC